MKKKIKKFVVNSLRSFINLLFLNEKIRKISLKAAVEIYSKSENFNYNFKENGEFWLLKSISGLEEEILFDIVKRREYSLELQKQNPHSSIYCFEASQKTFKNYC